MGIRLRIYEAIRHERAQVLNPQSCESTESRNGYSNGRKFKSVDTRFDPITGDIPQVRGGPSFHPSAQDAGMRTEKALNLPRPGCASKASPSAKSPSLSASHVRPWSAHSR